MFLQIFSGVQHKGRHGRWVVWSLTDLENCLDLIGVSNRSGFLTDRTLSWIDLAQLSGQLYGVGCASFFVVAPAEGFGPVGLTAVLVATGKITSGSGFAFPVQRAVPRPTQLPIRLFLAKGWEIKLVAVQQTETNRDHGDQQRDTDQPNQQRICVGQRNRE